MMGTTRKGDESVIQKKFSTFNSTMMAFFLPVIVRKKEKTNKQRKICPIKMIFLDVPTIEAHTLFIGRVLYFPISHSNNAACIAHNLILTSSVTDSVIHTYIH